MKKIFYVVAVSLFLTFSVFTQTTTPTPATATEATKKARKQTFRATKDQVMQAQKILKLTETGKNNPETKTAIKKYQADNGLKTSGSLSRETLEKMAIALTDKQKGMPATGNEDAKTTADSSDKPKRKAPFRASKEQIMQVQKMLKVEETGKLDDATREAIKKYQDSNAVKVTGTLNKETLMKMGIELTDKQKEY